MYMQHVIALQAHKLYGEPQEKLRYRQGRADNSTVKLLCPAVIICQGTMSLVQMVLAHSSSASWGDANELMHRQEHNIVIARPVTTAVLMLALTS